MPDSPDYSKYLLGSVRFSLQDMGELAARLHSPMVYDRRGEVQYIDTFNSGLGGWSASTSGAGSSVKVTAENTYMWPYAIKMVAGTTLSKNAIISKVVASVGARRIGSEFVFAITNAFDDIRINLYGNSGSVYNEGFIKITYTSPALYVKTSSSVYTKVADIRGIAFASPTYLPVKVVIDLENHTYSRIIIADVIYDVSGMPLFYEDSSTFQQISTGFQLYGLAAPSATAYVAQVILTVNEP